ncbi:MAG TPA: M1 family peptidase, partial [Verrucomicrobiae bacterium]|nr:M1 family peptidase [Verrucomicrobiae bacterium]
MLRQDVSVTLLPERQTLAGRSAATLSGGGSASFLLSPRAVVERVTLEGAEVPYRFSGGRLSAEVSPSARSGAVLAVEYRVVFDDAPPERIVSAEDPTYGVVAAITSQGAFLGGGSGWYPEPPLPPQLRTFTITAPQGMKGVTAGRLLSAADSGGRTVTSWSIDKPLAWLALAAGPYQVAGRDRNGISLSTWFYPENAPLSGKYLDLLSGYLDLYTGLLGPFPFEKFAVVENFLPTGYGYPSFTLIGGSLLRLPFIPTTSLPHELVHSWWGNGVEVA